MALFYTQPHQWLNG